MMKTVKLYADEARIVTEALRQYRNSVRMEAKWIVATTATKKKLKSRLFATAKTADRLMVVVGGPTCQ